jgi:DNA-binding LacI/PurR family transcriptional regulator
MRITLRHIASQASVSETTVSKVLNGKHIEARITPDCAKRVWDIANQLGYRTNVAAKATATGRFDTVGLLKVEGQGIGLGQLPEGLLTGIERQFSHESIRLNFTTIGHNDCNDGQIPPALREAWGDGLMLFGCWEIPLNIAKSIQAMGLPYVTLGVRQPLDAVFTDEFDAALKATEHLLSLGHKRIAYVPDNFLYAYALHDRQQAYTQAMQQAGLTPMIVNLPAQHRTMEVRAFDDKYAQRVALLTSPNRPTAIIADTVDQAYPLLGTAWQVGLKVPDDFSLLTFHDVLASQLGPTITTMLIKTAEYGETAAKLLLKLIRHPREDHSSRTIGYQLEQGHTTASPRSA